MVDERWIAQQATQSFERIEPFLKLELAAEQKADPQHWATLLGRLEVGFDRIFRLLYRLYGHRYDFFYHLQQILVLTARESFARNTELRALDVSREQAPSWFHDQRMVGGVCYVDRFAGDLTGLRERIPYFKELGLTYLHLMPLFRCPEGDNDGGYAVSSYRDVDPRLGTMNELRELTGALREAGISLVIDFVFNHTSDEHEWAWRAQAGDTEYQDYYWMFDDRTLPDQYQRNLRDIFPDRGSGAFSWDARSRKWVWTTFYTFQWDLNYQNPAVFRAMLGEMLFLANVGVEVLRMDAVAFLWKRLGTNSENQPEAHMILQAYNALMQVAAPSVLFKSEAIVHPDEVLRYISPGECQISYNPLLMALLWESIATRKVTLLRRSLQRRFALDPRCAWVNYLRCHDDIGWTFDDNDASEVGINAADHRRFLNQYYTGRFEGSFARGLPFQENPQTGDCRVSGTLASLVGLELAIRRGDPAEVDLAVRRVVMLHAVILSIGGVPLLYLGDEVGMLNDYSFASAKDKAHDSRWVHRPRTDWEKLRAALATEGAPAARIYRELLRLIALRKRTTALAGGDTTIIHTGSEQVFGYVCHHDGERLVGLASFSEQPALVPGNELRVHGAGYSFYDLISDRPISLDEDLVIAPYEFLWLVEEPKSVGR